MRKLFLFGLLIPSLFGISLLGFSSKTSSGLEESRESLTMSDCSSVPEGWQVRVMYSCGDLGQSGDWHTPGTGDNTLDWCMCINYGESQAGGYYHLSECFQATGYEVRSPNPPYNVYVHWYTTDAPGEVAPEN